MRLGASYRPSLDNPEEIARFYVDSGYSAAVCPTVSVDQPERMRAIVNAFARHNILLAEVGAWNNMMDIDPAKRAANLQANIERLALADAMGVRCCVNIAGSYNAARWDGPHPANLSAEAFELTVQNVRTIIDAVKPKRSFYAIEPMPWVIPDGPDSYVDLVQAVERKQFAVHLDPVNWISSPQRYFQNASLLRECFAKLGQWIVSCHGKDTMLSDRLTTQIAEIRPGLGALDYTVYLHELNRLPADTPLIIEHLPAEDYPPARDYVLAVAKQAGLAFIQPTA